MLKDIEDSRRANNAVHSELTRAAAATATASNSTVSSLLALFVPFFCKGAACGHVCCSSWPTSYCFPPTTLTDTLLHRQTAAGGTSHLKAVDYVIISDNYWPSIPKDVISYHPEVAGLLQQYQDTFAVLKKPRKLHPAQTLGQVELELDFEDGTTRLFLVSPMQVCWRALAGGLFFVFLYFYHVLLLDWTGQRDYVLPRGYSHLAAPHTLTAQALGSV